MVVMMDSAGIVSVKTDSSSVEESTRHGKSELDESISSRQYGKHATRPSRSSTHSRKSDLTYLEEGTTDDDNNCSTSSFSSDGSILWEHEPNTIKNPVLRGIVSCLICFRCMPKDPADSTPLKNGLRGLQWMAIIFDLTAAIVAIASFSGTTLCCGSPVLNIIGTAPWDTIIPIGSYVYAGMIVLEIYPVIRKGFPFNIINPLFGCALAIACFFDDSYVMAMSMWGLEALAVLCECTIYLLKAKQKRERERDMVRIGRLTKRDLKPNESITKHEREIAKARRQYRQLKEEYSADNKVLWYLAVGNCINLALIGSVLVLIVFVNMAGGLCIDIHGGIPNPFDRDQIARCYECPQDPSQNCEVCAAENNMCYYAYS